MNLRFVHLFLALFVFIASPNWVGAAEPIGNAREQAVAEEMASAVKRALFDLNTEQVKDIVAFTLKSNKAIKALTIIDSYSKEAVLSFSRAGSVESYDKILPKNLQGLTAYTAPIVFNEEKIGDLNIYYEAIFAADVKSNPPPDNGKAGQDLARKIAAFTNRAIYNLDEDQLLAVLENFLEEHPEIKGLVVTETIDQEILLTYFRQNNQVVYGETIPNDIQAFSSFAADSIFEGSTIGTVQIYYVPASTGSSAQIDILTAEERAWIKNNPVMTVGVEEWFPFIRTNGNGTTGGISGDFITLVLKKTGLKIKVISDEWSTLLADFKDGKIDLLPATYYTDKRATYGLYSNPYFTAKEFLYVKQGTSSARSFADLKGKKLAIVTGFGTIPKIREKFPDIEIVETKNQLASLYAVLNEDVEATFESQFVIEELIRTELITGIQGIAQNIFKASSLFFFSHREKPLLQSILTKALDSITETEKRQLMNKWVKAQDSAASRGGVQTQEEAGISWMIVGVILVFVVMLLSALLLPRILSDEKLANHFGSTRFRMIAMIATSLMVVLVAGLVWRALEQNKSTALASTADDLDVVIHGTMDRLDSWIQSRQNFLLRLGRDPELVAITKRLLAVPAVPEILKGSLPLADARAFFKKNEAEFGKIGFFIIDKDTISVGSGRDANLGTKNLIAEQKPYLLSNAFQGQAVFIPPIRSDVSLTVQDNASEPDIKKPLTMFFAVPIRDTNGLVLAVLTQRLKPEGRLSKIMQAGRLGQSGESYLIDHEGVQVTESRFKTDLIKIGLLSKDVSKQVRIQVRDPGGNMMDGFQPKKPMAERSLTQMAADLLRISADTSLDNFLNGYSDLGRNVDTGYRDYRGVQVFGTWVWNERLGLGIASEIDVDEAFSGYYSLRLSLLVITGITLLLTISALLVTLMLGEKATLTMRKSRDELEDRVIERTQELKATNDLITESIQYASRIQRSILPDDGVLSAVTQEHFVIWEPRDVVGGDIYWHGAWGDGCLIILGDCTGHGVPGAFMTLISIGALERAMSEIEGGNVGELVSRVHQYIQVSLSQHYGGGHSDDGIELGACYFVPEEPEMTFVGARFELMINDGAEVTTIKGTKAGMGYRGIPYDQGYDENTVSLKMGQTFYMTTDGLVDQVGGERKRMYGKRRLKKLLLEIEQQSMNEQKKSVYRALLDYQDLEKRRDDVSIIGFRF
ncbi:MAG: hypothetical protein COB46_08870 [Rhodospirillaceae bacterium]|nr:MAG: hypothetical protein COB46_08870 [Rhodospirillaceae bacterium]